MSRQITIAPQDMSQIFTEYLKDQSILFVFSTDVVMNSWIDWCVMHEKETGTSALPLERFISWDKFKGSYVSASEPGKMPVPALLRKIFISSLIQKNAAQKFFKKIINPQFADTASSFTDWICRILPSLGLWHKLTFGAASSGSSSFKADEEDRDYKTLYDNYKSFLDSNNFFEPAWVRPDFSASGKKILIIYPELLEDFADYMEVFDECPDITLVMLPQEKTDRQSPLCIKYPDSRRELRMTLLAIRKIVEEKKADWTDITLSVPDLQTYRPYLERELKAYCIPYVIRAGFPLTSNCAGVIFKEILDCYNSNFSYDSVRRLLLDNYIPWKAEDKEARENLIREGQRLRCICGYDKADGRHVDIWKEALSRVNHDERELNFYKQLKKDLTAICNSSSFEAIHTAWMSFKARYLQESDFSETADKIISRCITELNALIAVEKDYCKPLNLTVEKPYDFFINELASKSYTPQNSAAGLSVFPYKLSAAANFKYQFVIDSSQNNLEIPFKRLSFLNAGKRGLLKLTDEDKKFNASKAFIRLYAKSAADGLPAFSCAEESFAGFAIAHTYLDAKNEKDFEPVIKELEKSDFIQNEKSWFLAPGTRSGAIGSMGCLSLSKAQQDQFFYWDSFNQDRFFGQQAGEYQTPGALQEKIRDFLIQNRNKHNPDQDQAKITISQSDMKNFFPCPRKWIFSTVLKLEADSLSTSLIGRYDMGNIHHKVLELYGSYLMQQNLPLPKLNDKGDLENQSQLEELLAALADKAIKDPDESYSKSPLTEEMLHSQIPAITKTIIDFLKSFCTKFAGYKVKGVEKWYSGRDDKRSWNYTGKIDCILTAGNANPADTGWTIIDYKNTASAMPKQSETRVAEDGSLQDFQIPMYITLIRENEKVKEISLAAFYAINASSSGQKNTVVVDQSNKNKQIEEYESTIQTFVEYAKEFARCVENAAYPLEKVDSFEDCGSCEYKSICRYNYTIAGRTK